MVGGKENLGKFSERAFRLQAWINDDGLKEPIIQNRTIRSRIGSRDGSRSVSRGKKPWMSESAEKRIGQRGFKEDEESSEAGLNSAEKRLGAFVRNSHNSATYKPISIASWESEKKHQTVISGYSEEKAKLTKIMRIKYKKDFVGSSEDGSSGEKSNKQKAGYNWDNSNIRIEHSIKDTDRARISAKEKSEPIGEPLVSPHSNDLQQKTYKMVKSTPGSFIHQTQSDNKETTTDKTAADTVMKLDYPIDVPFNKSPSNKFKQQTATKQTAVIRSPKGSFEDSSSRKKSKSPPASERPSEENNGLSEKKNPAFDNYIDELENWVKYKKIHKIQQKYTSNKLFAIQEND